jgi:hypothetical protein
MLPQLAKVVGFTVGRTVKIPSETDRKFRRALLEGAAVQGGPAALWHIRNALEKGPDRDGAEGAIRYFGNKLNYMLEITAPVIDGLEVTIPGLKRWLELTGFGNDKTFIKGFVAWAEHTNAKPEIVKAARHGFEH